MKEKGKVVGRAGGWGADRQRNRQVNAQALAKLPFPKDPAVLKILRGSKFTLRSNFTIA